MEMEEMMERLLAKIYVKTDATKDRVDASNA
jgi:hypothetical protein